MRPVILRGRALNRLGNRDRAQAPGSLITHIYELQRREGADGIRLAPTLAGLDELLPWVHQWHPEIDAESGSTTGDYLQGLLYDRIARHGLTLAEVHAWAPAAATRGRRRRSGV